MSQFVIDRRSAIVGAAAALAIPAIGRAQSDWPNRPIKFVVSFPPGGLTDGYARVYGEQIRQKFGQPVVVENKPGAGGILGCEIVARAPADGYTFLVTIQTSLVQNQALYKKLPYDPNKDFIFISRFDAGHLPLVVHKSTGAKNFQEFVAYAKTKPTNFGSYAPGSVAHLIGAQINKLYGTQIQVVNYRGEAPMWQDFMAGSLDAAVGSIQAARGALDTGTGIAAAVPTLQRSKALPNVATFAEQGATARIFTMEGWVGLLAPAGVAPEIVAKISQAVLDSADAPEVRRVMDAYAIAKGPSTPQEFARIFRDDTPHWLEMVRELGVTLD
jgi:tripartite-type tricarboxylate transporter receptor subunit TctC